MIKEGFVVLLTMMVANSITSIYTYNLTNSVFLTVLAVIGASLVGAFVGGFLEAFVDPWITKS